MVSRRRFLEGLTAAALCAGASRLGRAGELGVGTGDGPVFNSLIDLLRETPRERLLETLIKHISNGLAYEQLLGAVAEAAAREVSPYPIVGFKYHAFMVMQSVHLTTLHGRSEDRWLPVLWAADLFKGSQARDEEQTGWTMGPAPIFKEKGARNATAAFVSAVERWDPEAADAAIVGLLHALPLEQVFELLFRNAARDFRHIGHKAITAANCHRLIQSLGPGRAIPMLRSLTYAMQNHGDGPNPLEADLPADRPWRRNLELAATLPKDWLTRNAAFDPVAELLPVLREGSAADAARAVVALIKRGAGPVQIWPALFTAAGELLLRQSGIIAVHANTTCNALHYAFQRIHTDQTRRLLLLQAASFLPLFRDLLQRGKQRDLTIDGMAPLEISEKGVERVPKIFAELHTDRVRAARQTLAYLSSGGAAVPFMAAARRYTVSRNTGFHDYKFTEAAFENARVMNPPWRERYLAASTLYLNGAGDQQNVFVSEAKQLLATSEQQN